MSDALHMTYDASANAAYIYVVEEINAGASMHQEVIDPYNMILDFDVNGKLLGIEILDASKILSQDTIKAAEQIG